MLAKNGSGQAELLIRDCSGQYFDISIIKDESGRINCESRLLPKGSRAGYNACWQGSVTITKDLVPKLDFPLRALIGYWQRTAKETTHACPVKYAGEVFNYKGQNYTISPGLVGLSGESFEAMMLLSGEIDLVGIGAKKVYCTAMID